MHAELNIKQNESDAASNSDWAYEDAEVILPEDEVVSMVRLQVEEIRKRVTAGTFPMPVCGGSYWIENEVLKWIFESVPVTRINHAA